MKKLLSILAISALLAACSSTPEQVEVPTADQLVFKDVQEVKKKQQAKPVVKKRVVKPVATPAEQPKTEVEYKQAEKQMIKELKQRFQEINKQEADIVIVEQEPEKVEFSEPVNPESLIESLQETANQAQEQVAQQEVTTVQEDTQAEKVNEEIQKAVGLSDKIVLEEKDSFKQEQEFAKLKEILIALLIAVFLAACLYIGLKKK